MRFGKPNPAVPKHDFYPFFNYLIAVGAFLIVSPEAPQFRVESGQGLSKDFRSFSTKTGMSLTKTGALKAHLTARSNSEVANFASFSLGIFLP